MIDNLGCSQDEPGIGDIAYVKDLQTETVLATNFRCSVFGKYEHASTGFGWVSAINCMNHIFVQTNQRVHELRLV